MHFFFFLRKYQMSVQSQIQLLPMILGFWRSGGCGRSFRVNSRSTLATHPVLSPPGLYVTLPKPRCCSIDVCSSKSCRKRAASTLILPVFFGNWLCSAHVCSTFFWGLFSTNHYPHLSETLWKLCSQRLCWTARVKAWIHSLAIHLACSLAHLC